MFCFKWCNDDGSNPDGKCQHTLDRIGTSYNCPSKYTLAGYAEGEFEVCDSGSFPVPGIYTDSAGATQSYSQPPESLGAITTVPYDPTAAPTSNCKTYASSELFTAFGSAPTGASSSATGSATGSTSGSGSAQATGSATGTMSTARGTASAAPSGSSSASTNGTSSGSTDTSGAAEALGVSVFATVAGVLAAAVFFA